MTATDELRPCMLSGFDDLYFLDMCHLLNLPLSEWRSRPFVIRILLEAALREQQPPSTLNTLINYSDNVGVPFNFKPSRVLLQDLSGLPALLDLAAARSAALANGNEEMIDVIDSRCPVDVVVDHAVQIDFAALPKRSLATPTADYGVKPTDQPQVMAQDHAAPNWQSPMVLMPPALMVGNTVYLSSSPMLTSSATLLTSEPPLMTTSASSPALIPSLSVVPPPTPSSSSSSSSMSSPPTDNPGLPVLESVCPFHHRLSYWSSSLAKKEADVLEKQREKFEFLKWADRHLSNVTVIPPGTGVLHQSNLEYLARVVCVRAIQMDDEKKDGTDHDEKLGERASSFKLLFPDTCLGTDSHTTSVNGLGVLGIVSSTLDAETIMFGHHMRLNLPKIVGCRLIGEPQLFSTSTDIVLLITKTLRAYNKDEKEPVIVEFTGQALKRLSVSDRVAIATMSAEFNAISAFFPVDAITIEYLRHTHRDREKIDCVESYLRQSNLFNEYDDVVKYDREIVIDLANAVPMVSCNFNKTNHKAETFAKIRIPLQDVKSDFWGKCKLGLLAPSLSSSSGLGHGCVLLSALASCSNASNPSVMLGAGLLAQKAVERGLKVPSWVKATLAPGSGVVTSYLQESGVMPYLHKLGFEVVGYGCATCDHNHKRAQISESVLNSMNNDSLICCGLFSGNRNMEHRLENGLRANYLSSPMLVIAYSIAGRIDVDLMTDPLAFDKNNEPIYLKDIWPSKNYIRNVELNQVLPAISSRFVNCVDYGSRMWSKIDDTCSDSKLFNFSQDSNMIRAPKYIFSLFKNDEKEKTWITRINGLRGVRCLIKLDDNVSADMISPAGSIVRNSSAADYLVSMGLQPRQFNSYGSRRGNFEVMMRGAFAHPRLHNLLISNSGSHTKNHNKSSNNSNVGMTIHMPSGLKTSIQCASEAYSKTKTQLCVIAGHNFGRGCNRDWAVRSLFLLGIKAVLAKSFDEDYRRHLVNMAILPIVIEDDVYEMITGVESIDVHVNSDSDDEVILVLNKDMDLTARLGLSGKDEERVYGQGGILKAFLEDIKSQVNTTS